MPDFSYNLSTVHYLMLKDKVRTMTYYKAINKYISDKDFVADLGSGSGILSFFASENAKKVYSIEITDLINEAQKTARINNLFNIEFIQSDIFNVNLNRKLDIIIHEQIGDYLWDEDMIAKISVFKEKFLKPTGMIFPNIIELYLVPSDYKHYSERVMEYWDSKPYGIDFSLFKKLTFKERINDYLYPFKVKLHNSNNYLSKPQSVYTLNLMETNTLPSKIESKFLLEPGKNITGILGFMKVKFSDELFFYTNHYNPNNELTHWHQFFIPMFNPQTINQKTELDFILYPTVNSKKWKWEFNFKEIP